MREEGKKGKKFFFFSGVFIFLGGGRTRSRSGGERSSGRSGSGSGRPGRQGGAAGHDTGRKQGEEEVQEAGARRRRGLRR